MRRTRYTLHLVYSGDVLFQGSSNDIDADGGAASRHRAVRQ
jgi:hypothetical protein